MHNTWHSELVHWDDPKRWDLDPPCCANLGTFTVRLPFLTLQGGCESSLQTLSKSPKAKPKVCLFQSCLTTSPYLSVFAKGRLKHTHTHTHTHTQNSKQVTLGGKKAVLGDTTSGMDVLGLSVRSCATLKHIIFVVLWLRVKMGKKSMFEKNE